MIEPEYLPIEAIVTQSRQSLGHIYLDWTPQPGNYLDVEGKTYVVLERHHRYQLQSGRYKLSKVALYLQTATRPDEQSLVDGEWVVGDASCLYNAKSPLIRCATNPTGPCEGCRYYLPGESNF
jgi:Family of unknown function (DUF6464)